MGEIAFMIFCVACPLILWSLFLNGFARWFWFSTMTSCLLSVLIAEAVGKITYGHSISQMFWEWSELHPWTAILTLALLMFGWAMLITHLAWRLIKRHLLKK